LTTAGRWVGQYVLEIRIVLEIIQGGIRLNNAFKDGMFADIMCQALAMHADIAP
jgi:hypothetical protein